MGGELARVPLYEDGVRNNMKCFFVFFWSLRGGKFEQLTDNDATGDDDNGW